MTTKELARLIARDQESKDVEFKGSMAWDESDKRACCEIVKDILAMANTGGGAIIVGVEEHTDRVPRYAVEGGLTEAQLSSFEATRLNNFVRRYADPPVNTALRPHLIDGRRLVEIGVPDFPNVPHVCTRDFPEVLRDFTLYVRTDATESAPIRSSGDMHVLIEHATRKREGAIAEAVRRVLAAGSATPAPSAEDEFAAQIEQCEESFARKRPWEPGSAHGYRGAYFHPATFSSARWSLPAVAEALEHGQLNITGMPWLVVDPRVSAPAAIQDGYSAQYQDTDLTGSDFYYYWEARQSGLLFHREAMWEDGDPRQRIVGVHMDARALLLYLGQAILVMDRVYEGLGLDAEPVTLAVSVVGARDRTLSNETRTLLPIYKSAIERIDVRRTEPLAVWRGGTARIAAEMAAEVFWRFNWRDPPTDYHEGWVGDALARRL